MIATQFAPPQAPKEAAPGLREDTPDGAPASAVPWGIGWSLKGAERAWPSGDLGSPATYGHGGSSGTMVWADPAVDVTCVLLTNRAFASGWAADRPRLSLFSNAVLAAVR
jgi:CubicO group peptidase (beta-lactamase class C family)